MEMSITIPNKYVYLPDLSRNLFWVFRFARSSRFPISLYAVLCSDIDSNKNIL